MFVSISAKAGPKTEAKSYEKEGKRKRRLLKLPESPAHISVPDVTTKSLSQLAKKDLAYDRGDKPKHHLILIMRCNSRAKKYDEREPSIY